MQLLRLDDGSLSDRTKESDVIGEECIVVYCLLESIDVTETMAQAIGDYSVVIDSGCICLQ